MTAEQSSVNVNRRVRTQEQLTGRDAELHRTFETVCRCFLSGNDSSGNNSSSNHGIAHTAAVVLLIVVLWSHLCAGNKDMSAKSVSRRTRTTDTAITRL